MMRAGVLLALVGCGAAAPPLRLDESWPKCGGDYDATTRTWTRKTTLQGEYQEVLELGAVFKSPDWRAAHAARDAEHRRLDDDGRARVCSQARADMAGPYEVELLVTTWDRRENDLDRGKKSVWHVVLVDEQGHEVEPLEIVKDKRPTFTLRAEFPSLGDFAIAYVARFPRCAAVNADEGSGSGSAAPRSCKTALLGPDVHALRLRMSSERGGVELTWSTR